MPSKDPADYRYDPPPERRRKARRIGDALFLLLLVTPGIVDIAQGGAIDVGAGGGVALAALLLSGLGDGLGERWDGLLAEGSTSLRVLEALSVLAFWIAAIVTDFDGFVVVMAATWTFRFLVIDLKGYLLVTRGRTWEPSKSIDDYL